MSSPHAGCQRIITASGSDGKSGKVTSARSKDPSTPCTSRLGPPSTKGNAVAIAAWAGVPKRKICASARRSTIRALLSSGRTCLVLLSMRWSRSTDQRKVSCAIAIAKARSGGERPLVALAVAWSMGVPIRITVSSNRKAARRVGRPEISSVMDKGTRRV